MYDEHPVVLPRVYGQCHKTRVIFIQVHAEGKFIALISDQQYGKEQEKQIGTGKLLSDTGQNSGTGMPDIRPVSKK